jgi:hypothetical protein
VDDRILAASMGWENRPKKIILEAKRANRGGGMGWAFWGDGTTSCERVKLRR